MARLKPWQRLTLLCDRCGEVATRRVVVDGEPEFSVEDGRISLRMGANERPDLGAALACEAHAGEITGELCDEHGGAMSDPLRSSWRYWFETDTRVGRPFGDASVRLHNWRFDRRRGK